MNGGIIKRDKFVCVMYVHISTYFYIVRVFDRGKVPSISLSRYAHTLSYDRDGLWQSANLCSILLAMISMDHLAGLTISWL